MSPRPGTLLGQRDARCRSRDGAVDVCFSRNVLEHVPRPVADGRRDGPGDPARRAGLLSYTLVAVALGRPRDRALALPRRPLRAAAATQRAHGHAPKNRFGETLFAVAVADALRWARAVRRGRSLLAALPRYHPRWAHWVVRVPGVREVATWNLLLVLRRR